MTTTAARRMTAASAEADAGLQDVAFMTFPGVEIAHVGMDWPASTGPVTLTFQHLADAVTAANDDPHILNPRLKIGHTDPRFNEDPPVHDPFAYHGPLRDDGNPVYGKVTNLRLAEDGLVLLGDYIEVPQWLGDALPSAYPSRSLEGDFDIQTDGGKHYSFVITAVSLLGEPLPAISCLEDLVRELTGGPAAVSAQTPVTLKQKEDPMPPVSAEASTDSIKGQFWDEFAVGDRYWWWPCEIRVNDGWVLADDDEGHYFRVPVTVDNDGNATFGEPEQGVLDFRPTAPTTESGEPVAASRGARFSTPAAAGRPKDRVRAATATNERSDVDVPTLREKLEMPDATDDEVIAAAAERLTDEPAAAVDAPNTESLPEPVAAAAGTVVDPAALEQLKQDARLGREAREQQLNAEREAIVAERVRAGAITAASSTHHVAELSKGGEIEKTHRAYLASLATGVIPVSEHGQQPTDHTADRAALSAIGASFGSTRDWGKGSN